MFWELYQQSQISQANSQASRAASDAKSVAHSVRALEDKIDSLSLTCQALWEILRDETKLTEEQLEAKIKEIDLRDGMPDGKLDSGGRKCNSCSRTYNRRHLRCMYCGEQNESKHIFEP